MEKKMEKKYGLTAKQQKCVNCGEPLSDEDVAMHRWAHWDCKAVKTGK